MKGNFMSARSKRARCPGCLSHVYEAAPAASRATTISSRLARTKFDTATIMRVDNGNCASKLA
jgi:hypothetical protein